MPDIEDVFLPLGPEVFVDPVEARWGDQHRCEDVLIGLHRSIIQDTLATIPDRAHDTTVRESVLGSAVCAALAALVRAALLTFGFWRSSCWSGRSGWTSDHVSGNNTDPRHGTIGTCPDGEQPPQDREGATSIRSP